MVNVAMCFSFFPKLWYSTQFYRCFAKTLCIGVWMDPLYKWFSFGWLLGISLIQIETVWLSFIVILMVLVMNSFPFYFAPYAHMYMASTENSWDLLASLAL